MMALSIRQPWAWLIVHGFKPVENRTWPTPHRGETLIHAGQVFDSEGLTSVLRAFPELRAQMPQQYELGGIVGVATVVDCVEHHPNRFFTGPYGHVMSDARPLPFTRWPGRLGYFQIPDGTAELALRGGLAVSAEQVGLF